MRFDATTGTELELDAETLGDISAKIGFEANDLARRVEKSKRPIVSLGTHHEDAFLLDVLQRVGQRGRRVDHRRQRARNNDRVPFLVHVVVLVQ